MTIFLWVLGTAVATVLLTLVVMNFLSGEKKIQHRIGHDYAVGDPQFARSMGNLLPPAIVPGNRIDPLVNGDQIFPAMLDSIRAARRTICFETYIYWEGTIGQSFADALAERARAGVRVNVLLDWAGSVPMKDALLRQLTDAGVVVERYHPIRFYTIHRLNNRTHRKLLIVDGAVAFTGGVGVSDDWLGDAQDPKHWRDTHYRLTGPAVAQMQAAFMDNWLKTRAEVLHGDAYFPPLEPDGSCHAQVFMSSPQEGSESVRLMYLLSIACSARSIRISSAYFVPDDLCIEALVGAARRGVRVQVILPGRHIDQKTVRKASRGRWGTLLEAGVEIYEYQPTMYHCKVMIADEAWTSVGSTNFDNRSFRLNDEANLNVFDESFARAQAKLFEHDLTRARQVSLEEWKNRPLKEKVVERLAGLVRSQL